MKQILVILLFSFSFIITKAQSGSILLGGDVSYNSTKTPFTGSSLRGYSIGFNPYIGYQFNDNWTAGLTSGFFYLKSSQPIDNYQTKSFSAGPFVRYTKSLSGLFSIYGQLESRFGKDKYIEGATTITNNNVTSVNLFPAAFINLKNNFGLNFNFGGMSYQSSKPNGGSAIKTFNFNFGKVVNIGISKNFGGKK